MHIALLAASPAPSHGWGRYVRDLVTALAPAGLEITLITSTDAPPDAGLPVQHYQRILPSLTPAPRLSALRHLAAIPAVRQLTAPCDVVHVTAEPYALSLSGLDKPIIVTAHGTYLPHTAQHPVWGALYRRVYRRSRILCVSSYTERQVKAALPDAQSLVILNGVDAERYRARPSALPEKHGPAILAVGQVKARKGQHILTQALPAIRAAVPNAEVIVIGSTDSDPAYVAAIRAQLTADGLANAVRWLGRAPDETLLGWFHAADVFALPALNVGGRFEGFGLVYLEASAAGLPVVGTRDCGAEDAIRDGQTGFIVPQNDPGAVAEVVIRLLQDPALRQCMGAAGSAFAGEHTWAKVAAEVLALYRTTARR
jgi:glycosyltransferase involved in cell wall biosynthesis